jgi:hypothetical protein
VVNLIQQFPSSLEIIVGCARKIEIALWQKLFEIAGSPYDLFNVSFNVLIFLDC